MKLLKNQPLELIAHQLNGQDITNNDNYYTIAKQFLSCKIETYSCKLSDKERKEYKKYTGQLGQNPKYVHEALSPPQHGCIDLNNHNKTVSEDGLTYLEYDSSEDAPPRRPNSTSENILGSEDAQNLITPATIQTSDYDLSISDTSGYSSISPNFKSKDSSSSPLEQETKRIGGYNEIDKLLTTKQFTCIASSKTLFYLKSCLTNSFNPDYDFSDAEADEFSREPNFWWVKAHVDQMLNISLKDFCENGLLEGMWSQIDKTIHIRDCQIYSYNPNISKDNDPFENCLWSFVFIFYNIKLNRMVLLICSSEDERVHIDDNTYISSDELDDLENEYYDETENTLADHLFRRGFTRQRSESLSKTAIEKEKEEKERKSRYNSVSSSKTGFNSSFCPSIDGDTRESSSSIRENNRKNYYTADANLKNELINELRKENNIERQLSGGSKERKRTVSSCSKLFPPETNFEKISNAYLNETSLPNERISIQDIFVPKQNVSCGEMSITITAVEEGAKSD